MAGPADTLFNDLDRKHPDYEEWVEEWKTYRDMIGDRLVDLERYLPKSRFEPDTEYEFRKRLTQFIPESPLAIERIVGALYSEKPKRELKGQEDELSEFLDDADRKGNSWNNVIEEIATKFLAYGTTRILVNVPMVELTPADAEQRRNSQGETVQVEPVQLTRAEEKALGIRPFVVFYTPLSTTDWECDELGKLNFVRIREDRTVKPLGGTTEKRNHRKLTRFIEYDREVVRWWDFIEGDKGEKQLIDAQVRTHGLGIVPMVVEPLREIKPMVGHSFIRYSSKADIRKLQGESDQAYDTYLHAHPFLAIWTEEELKEVGIGSSAYLKLNPGIGGSREDAKYLEAPKSAFEALSQVIEDARVQIFRQAQVDPMGVISRQGFGSAFQASGVSRAWSFGTSEARLLSRIANRMEAIERGVFEIVLRYQSDSTAPGKVFKGSIQYPEEFDLASTAQLLAERAEIGALINSPTLLKIIDKRIASSKIGDTTAAELKKVHGEIDANPLIGTQAGKSRDMLDMPGFGEDDIDGDGLTPSRNRQPNRAAGGAGAGAR